ncbi:MAG: hypothetical protein CFH06_00274 [Alphaproteobacteria bacterium MarineAlpha3_Bin5]|nr:MAG: hypothetical protein CFH06_00274 [Alphaproteobacteria bacterium MarineAlpha3_Bin5]
MTPGWRFLIWLGGLFATGLFLHLLGGILFPFVVGMVIAYFFDPIVDRLELTGVSRTLATFCTLTGCFFLFLSILFLLIPILHEQILTLIRLLPIFFDSLRTWIDPILVSIESDIESNIFVKLKKATTAQVGMAVHWVSTFLTSILSGGLAIFNMLSLVFITPLVAFYLLRDWDKLVAEVNSWLPLDSAETIRAQAQQVDKTMAGFVRGQATVCVLLAVFYGALLTIVGLKAGILLGVFAGILAFIPFIGWTVAFVIAMAMSFAQFDSFVSTAFVSVIMIVGAITESYFLTPWLVGGRVGLSPIWIIFAMLSGGALFGFTGVLLSIPVASVVGVLLRFWLKRYLQSTLFHGGSDNHKELK